MGFNFLGTRSEAARAAVSADQPSSHALACLLRQRRKPEARVAVATSEQVALETWEDEGGTPVALPSPRLDLHTDDDVTG
jgi:hypothetical protein